MNVSIKEMQDNAQLIEVLIDLVNRSQREGKKFLYFDYQAANRSLESSLKTLIKLLEVTK